ncbi:MAG TPA: hypothetical protein VGJ73_16840, partial [Verrucomicrobiae bacterium]
MLSQRILLLLIVFTAPVMAAGTATPFFKVENHRLIMDNGFVHLEFNERHASIDVAKADFSGQGHYGGNLLATNRASGAGIVLETVDPSGRIQRASDVHSSITYKIIRQGVEGVSICI